MNQLYNISIITSSEKRKLIFITKTEGSNPTPPPPPPPPTCEEKYPAPAGYSVEDTDFGT